MLPTPEQHAAPRGSTDKQGLPPYAMEKKRSKTPERFGRGAIEGVAGPETANNAAVTAAFIPLLTLGIPANAVMALMFGALLLQGITPGPQLITENPEIFWGIVDSMCIGNIILLVLSVPLVRPVHHAGRRPPDAAGPDRDDRDDDRRLHDRQQPVRHAARRRLRRPGLRDEGGGLRARPARPGLRARSHPGDIRPAVAADPRR